MVRNMWTGSISFGLVSIPVKLYTATEPKEISFSLLCKNNHSLSYKRWCSVEKREVPWEETKKGFKLAKDTFIVVEKEELEKLRLKTTSVVDIKEFVDEAKVDPIHIEKSYYVVPHEMGLKPYALFAEALQSRKRAAIGKVVLRQKEHIVAIRPYKQGLVMHSLFYPKELRSVDMFEELQKQPEIKKEELKLAEILIDKLTAKSPKLAQFEDAYTESLRALIKAKAEGEEYVIEEEKPEAVKDILEALRASIDAAGGGKHRKKEEGVA